jgi:hypothetical protein
MAITFVNGRDVASPVSISDGNGGSVTAQVVNGQTQLSVTDPRSLNTLDEIRLILMSMNDQMVLSGVRIQQ